MNYLIALVPLSLCIGWLWYEFRPQSREGLAILNIMSTSLGLFLLSLTILWALGCFTGGTIGGRQ